MVSVNTEKRIIFGWMVDFLCWDGLNDFLLTLNTNSIMRTHDLLNGCLASSALTLIDEVPYRRLMADLINFLTKICSGNNHQLNTKCRKTILETAVSELQQLKRKIPEFEDLELKLKIHAVIVCCTAGNFVLANQVYERLDLKSVICSELINESDRELLKTFRDILTKEDVDNEFLKNYSYDSFISTWVQLFQNIFNDMREPHLVEMCRGMIGNNKLVAIGADLSKITSDSCTNNAQSEGGKRITDCYHQMDKAIQHLNITSDFFCLLTRSTTKSKSRFFNAIKDECEGDLNSTMSEGSCSCDEQHENQNSGQKDQPSSATSIPIRECQVLCVPLEKDTNLPISLRNLGVEYNRENTSLHSSVSEDDEMQNAEMELCENNRENIGLKISFHEADEKQNEEVELCENKPSYIHALFSEDEDNEIPNDRMELDETIEAAVARICGEASHTDGEPGENDSLGETELFGSLSSLNSTPTKEKTPVSKLPKLDLTLGSRLSRRTTLTPSRKSPLKIPEEKKKLPWTSEEEDNLYYGIRVYGEGNWERIRCQFNLMHRNGGALSDKWRNLKTKKAKVQVLKKRYLQKLKDERKTKKPEDSPLY